MHKEFNKNDNQKEFNCIKGTITEINTGDKFSNITLELGNERKRVVNFCCKTQKFKDVAHGLLIGDKVSVTFFAVSNKSFERYYTNLNILDIKKL